MKIPFSKPVFDEEMRGAALDAVERERFVLEESVYGFVEEFAHRSFGFNIGSGFAVLLASNFCLCFRWS